MRILFSHLLNNYTGSPKVLRNSILAFSNDKNFNITVLTSKSDGFLFGIDGVRYKSNGYKWSSHKFGVAFYFVISQIVSFFKVVFSRKYDVLYANTIYNFGASLAAKLKGSKIIFHIHESYLNPNVLQRICLANVYKTADKIICVSHYLASTLESDKICIVYNSNAPQAKTNKMVSDEILENRFQKKIIMMPCSLKTYKGILQFVKLSEILPKFDFQLFCSATQDEIEEYKKQNNIILTQNLKIFPNQTDLLPYYTYASIVTNLSLNDRFVETFGMTLIEGFMYSLPVIAPNYGGPKEIVNNEVNGFLIEPFEIESVAEKMRFLLSDFEVYKSFAKNAFENGKKYKWEHYAEKIRDVVMTTCEGITK